MVPAAGARVHDGRLVVPIRNKDRELRSLQFIMADGKKLYLPDGEIKGCYFPIGKPADVICIGEGFATMATVHKATGHACVVAFQCGNVESVANVIRVKFPRATIVLCADDDHKTTGNPGLAKATVAARAVNGRLAVPVFPSDRADEATDFNDMAASAGLDAVSLCIASAIEKQEAPAQAIRVAGISADEWQRPEPLPAGLPPVAEFDFLLLPETLRPWAEDICERVQCPGDYVGASIMAALGSLIGRRSAYALSSRPIGLSLAINGRSWSAGPVFSNHPPWRQHSRR